MMHMVRVWLLYFLMSLDPFEPVIKNIIFLKPLFLR